METVLLKISSEGNKCMSKYIMLVYIAMILNRLKGYVEIFVAVKSLHHDKKSILHNSALHLIRQVIISTMQARLL